MICPRTGSKLKQITLDGIQIDISEGCGGIWFDRRELDKFDEAHETHGRELIEEVAPYIKKGLSVEERLCCPVDSEVVLMRRFFSPSISVEIDECPRCRGIWLDPGELEKIRSLQLSDKEKQAALQKMIEDFEHSNQISVSFEKKERQKQKSFFSNFLNFLK